MAQGGDRKSEGFSNGQNVHLKSRREIKDGTAGRIGKEYGVNGRTIRRDAEFAKGIDMAEKTAPGIKAAHMAFKAESRGYSPASCSSMQSRTYSRSTAFEVLPLSAQYALNFSACSLLTRHPRVAMFSASHLAFAFFRDSGNAIVHLPSV